MAVFLAISSQVSSEAVGLTASRFALERLGHEAWCLPTVILSNHPGRAQSPRLIVRVEALEDGVRALEANGFMEKVDAVFSGYLPTSDHVEFVKKTVARIKHSYPDVNYVCDPIIGDEGKGLYVHPDVATAIKDKLMPIADCITPNSFELGWLTGMRLEDLEEAKAAMGTLGPEIVVTTSFVSETGDTLVNLLQCGSANYCVGVPRLENRPHGSGDFFAALFVGALFNGMQPKRALGFAAEATRVALEAVDGGDRLEIVSTQEHWARAKPLLAQSF